MACLDLKDERKSILHLIFDFISFILIKLVLNKLKIKDKFVALGLEVPIQLRNMFESRKVRPIWKTFDFLKYFSLCTSSKMLNLDKVYLAQFLTFLGVLGIFRNLKMSSKQPFWFHLH